MCVFAQDTERDEISEREKEKDEEKSRRKKKNNKAGQEEGRDCLKNGLGPGSGGKSFVQSRDMACERADIPATQVPRSY